jgi:hypothetical protein
MVNRIIWTSVACAFFVVIVGGYAIFESTDYDEVITPVISNMEHTTRSHGQANKPEKSNPYLQEISRDFQKDREWEWRF